VVSSHNIALYSAVLSRNPAPGISLL